MDSGAEASLAVETPLVFNLNSVNVLPGAAEDPTWSS